MERENYRHLNQLLYYVSDIYRATKKFRFGEKDLLGKRIRRTAINISASMNNIEPQKSEMIKYTDIYPILSAVSVLETYLLIAREHKLLKDTSILNEKLDEVKDILYKYMDNDDDDDKV